MTMVTRTVNVIRLREDYCRPNSDRFLIDITVQKEDCKQQ